MKKMFFVGLIILVLAFSGCSEEPTGEATGSSAKEKPKPVELSPNAVEPECISGNSRPCIAIENCPGIQECVNGSWIDCKDAPDDGCPRDQSCIENWECQEWESCNKGVQKRKCVDSRECKTEFDAPDTIRIC